MTFVVAEKDYATGRRDCPCPRLGGSCHRVFPDAFPGLRGRTRAERIGQDPRGLGPAPPPAKFFFGSGRFAELVKMSHCSSVTTYNSLVSGLNDGDIQLVAPRTPGHTRLPVGVGSLPGIWIGLPFLSIPVAQSSLSTSFDEERYSPVDAIENIQKAVAIRVQQQLASVAPIGHVNQNRPRLRIPVMRVARSELEVPLHLSGIHVDRNNRA